MAGLRKTDVRQAAPRLGKDEEPIFELLSDQPLHVDSLAQGIDRSVAEVLRTLFDLEMRGLVRQLPGKMYVKA
jgi:DNA processing protein